MSNIYFLNLLQRILHLFGKFVAQSTSLGTISSDAAVIARMFSVNMVCCLFEYFA